MAKIGNIQILVDEFLKSTRVIICSNLQCRYLDRDLLCSFKKIEITKEGKCKQFEAGK